MERAVEELARYTSPVQGTKPRFVARDTEFFGADLKRGEIIMGLLAAANADPVEFDQPERLKLDRFPNPHLVFSSGIHFCLGMQLARVEAQSAISRLYGRYPNLELAAPDNLQWMDRARSARAHNAAGAAQRGAGAPGGVAGVSVVLVTSFLRAPREPRRAAMR